MYIAERDKKLKDITRNFTSDDYVKAKIIKETEQKIDNYFQDLEKNDRKTYNSYKKLFTYEFKDVNSGKEYRNSAGVIDEKQMIFVRSYPFNGEYLSSGGNFSYEEEGSGNITDQLNSMMYTEFQGKIAIAKTASSSHPIMVQYREYQAKQKMIYVYSLLSLLAFLISLYLYKKANIGQQRLAGAGITLYHRIPSDVRIGVLIGTGLSLLGSYYLYLSTGYTSVSHTDIDFIRNVVVYLVAISILSGLTFIQARDLFQVVRSQPQTEWEKSLIYKTYHGFQATFLE